MTEKQKMLAGALYDSRDPELLNRYLFARQLLGKINAFPNLNADEKNRAFLLLLGKYGENVWIETPFFCEYGDNIFIDSGTFININVFFSDNNLIEIGKNGLIGPSVQFLTASHPINAKERIIHHIDKNVSSTTYKTFSKPIKVGENAWIGANSVILPGITIGDNVTIGAGSLVTKNVPSGFLAYGNPCKIIKKI